MREVLIIILFANLIQLHAGDEFLYTWNSGKEEVGELSIEREVVNDETIYNYSSTIKVNAGIEMNIQEVWEAIYSSEHNLDYIKLENYFNGKSRIEITEFKKNDGIFRNINGREKSIERPEVNYSYICLFVEAPIGLTEVYSELYGTMFKVTETGKNNYLVIDSKNREHRFTYDENGRLQEAAVELSIGSFVLLPKE